jgi:hypothetical protein
VPEEVEEGPVMPKTEVKEKYDRKKDPKAKFF